MCCECEVPWPRTQLHVYKYWHWYIFQAFDGIVIEVVIWSLFHSVWCSYCHYKPSRSSSGWCFHVPS